MIFQHFSKRTLLLIGMLLVITAGLLYLALNENQPANTPAPTPVSKVSLAHSTLSLSQLSASDAATFGTGLGLHINTGSNKVTGVQFEIAFDPSIVSNVKVTQGTFFTTPIVLINTVDQKNGRIFYAIAISPTGTPVTGTGQAAVITYTLLPTAKTSTLFTFLPKTVVTQVGTLESVLQKANNFTLPLSVNPGGPNIPVASPAAR